MRTRFTFLSATMLFAIVLSACTSPTETPTATPTLELTPTPPATGSFSGTLWHDLCALPDRPLPDSIPAGCAPDGFGGAIANGTREPEEPGISGVQVELHATNCDGPVIADTVTDGTGAYSFTELTDGIYCVTVESNSTTNASVLFPGIWTHPTSLTSRVQLADAIVNGAPLVGLDFGWDFQFLPVYVETPPTQPVLLTATPTGSYFVVEVGANCRSGPDTVYEVITTFAAGTYLNLVGRNADSTWWYILSDTTNCWISSSTGTTTGTVTNLQVLAAPPTPVASAGPILSDPVARVVEVSYPSSCTSNTLQVAIKVTDNGRGINSVWLSYRYLTDSGIVGAWKTVLPNDNAAGGVYGFNYAIGAEAAIELGTQNGTLQYQFFAKDNSNNTSSYPNGSVLSMPIRYCP